LALPSKFPGVSPSLVENCGNSQGYKNVLLQKKLKYFTQQVLLKHDLSKSFDKLSWKYMKALLSAFGFNKDWVSWIMNLISSTFVSSMVNGVPSQPFSPSRGIRKGDPLSPFLFVIMA
jgi:hypothetical protein